VHPPEATQALSWTLIADEVTDSRLVAHAYESVDRPSG